MRSVKEWVGKHDDAKVPPAVRARVFLRAGGKCHISGRTIRPGDAWELEHIKPLWRDGEHRETNLAPALKASHAEKTAVEAGERAKASRIHAKHFGYHPPSKAKIRGRGFERTRG